MYLQATVCVLFHTTAIHRGFQTTVHIGNIRQTAVIEGIMANGGIHTNEKASALFRFLRHPEFVTVGMRLLFREGTTKGIGKITQVFPLLSVAGWTPPPPPHQISCVVRMCSTPTRQAKLFITVFVTRLFTLLLFPPNTITNSCSILLLRPKVPFLYADKW